MASSEDHDDGDRRSTPSASRSEGAYAFDESSSRFRVVVGPDRRPTGFLIRAPDENEARRQLMIAAIRLGFDRRGNGIALKRIDD